MNMIGLKMIWKMERKINRERCKRRTNITRKREMKRKKSTRRTKIVRKRDTKKKTKVKRVGR